MSEDAEEAEVLDDMAAQARTYISAFRWCEPILDQEMRFGVANVMAICLFTFSKPIGGSEQKLWVVTGDMPSAYLVVVEDDSVANAMERYCELMADWCEAVEQGTSLDEVFPVSASPTHEHASMLRTRIDTIRGLLLPQASRELVQP